VKTLDDLVDKALSRRSFLAAAGAVAASTALAGCSDDGTVTTSTGPYSDADVLNYALNLEYLEAEFYLRAATGSGLAAADTTPGSASTYQTIGAVTAGFAAAVPGLGSAQQALLNEIAYEEQEHVRFLRSTLGTGAVPRPALDLSFFGPLAYTAGVASTATGAGTFNPFSSFDNCRRDRLLGRSADDLRSRGDGWLPYRRRRDSGRGGLSRGLHPHFAHRTRHRCRHRLGLSISWVCQPDCGVACHADGR
jgi:hypothetical protein